MQLILLRISRVSNMDKSSTDHLTGHIHTHTCTCTNIIFPQVHTVTQNCLEYLTVTEVSWKDVWYGKASVDKSGVWSIIQMCSMPTACQCSKATRKTSASQEALLLMSYVSNHNTPTSKFPVLRNATWSRYAALMQDISLPHAACWHHMQHVCCWHHMQHVVATCSCCHM